MSALLGIAEFTRSLVYALIVIEYAPRTEFMRLNIGASVVNRTSEIRAHLPVSLLVVFILCRASEIVRFSFYGNVSADGTIYRRRAVSVILAGSMSKITAVFLAANGTLCKLNTGCRAALMVLISGDHQGTTKRAVYRSGTITVIVINVRSFFDMTAYTRSYVGVFILGRNRPLAKFVIFGRGILIGRGAACIRADPPVTAFIKVVFRIIREAMSLCCNYDSSTAHTLNGCLTVSVVGIRSMGYYGSVFLTANGTLCKLIAAFGAAGMSLFCCGRYISADGTGNCGGAISVVTAGSVLLEVSVGLAAFGAYCLFRAACFTAGMSGFFGSDLTYRALLPMHLIVGYVYEFVLGKISVFSVTLGAHRPRHTGSGSALVVHHFALEIAIVTFVPMRNVVAGESVGMIGHLTVFSVTYGTYCHLLTSGDSTVVRCIVYGFGAAGTLIPMRICIVLQDRVIVRYVSGCRLDHVRANGTSYSLGLGGSSSVGNMSFVVGGLTALTHMIVLFSVVIPFGAERVLLRLAVEFTAIGTLCRLLAGCSTAVVILLFDHEIAIDTIAPVHFGVRKHLGNVITVISVYDTAYLTGGSFLAARCLTSGMSGLIARL